MSKKIATGDLSGDLPGFDQVRIGLAPGRVGYAVLHDAARDPAMRRGHAHREWELNLVTRGWAEYLIDGRRVRLETDTVAWLLPSQPHLLLERSRDLLMWVVVFRPAVARRLCRDAAFAAWRGWLDGKKPGGPGHRVVSEASAADLSGLCQKVAALGRPVNSSSAEHPAGGKEAAAEGAGLAWLAAEAWAAFTDADDAPTGSHLHPAVERAARLLHDDPSRDDLDALASVCHISRPHLSRLFREQLGQSLTDYRNRQRADRFAQLVGRGGRMTLTQAAFAAGFGSYPQAFRVVKRLTGQSPRAWLR